MSRTRKGSKGPGWEPWSNLREKQEQAADAKWKEWKMSNSNKAVNETNGWKITRKEYLMGRDVAAPLTPELETNLHKLLVAVNLLRDLYGKPMTVSSGYRPALVNAATPGAAKKSAHMSCEACDFVDTDRKLIQWCLRNLDLLEKAGLYLESPVNTPTWVHVQSRPPKSGKRVFLA